MASAHPRSRSRQSSNSTTINAWFIEQLVDANNQVAYAGVSFINANGLIVTENSRTDTFAHELGHNFGLITRHSASPPEIRRT